MDGFGSFIKRTARVGVAALGILGLYGLSSGPSQALEIMNEDSMSFEALIIEGEKERTIVIAANSNVKNLCKEKCFVLIEGVGVFESQAGDTNRIKEGIMQNE